MDRHTLQSETMNGSLRCSLPQRRSVLRRVIPILLAGSILFSASGCQIIIGVLMILRGFPKENSDFRNQTRRNIEDKSKKVVVLCTSPEQAKMEDTAIDMEIMSEVSRQMRAGGINVSDENKILHWIDDHGGELQESDMLEISRKFDVDFVIQIKLEQFSFRDPASPGLYRGNVKAKIVGWARDEQAAKAKPKDPEKDDWVPPPLRLVYTKSFSTIYPVHQPVSADRESAPIFCKRFQERVAVQIAQLFYDHRLEEEL